MIPCGHGHAFRPRTIANKTLALHCLLVFFPRRYLLSAQLRSSRANSTNAYLASWDADIGTEEDIGIAFFVFDGINYSFFGVADTVRITYGL